MTLWGIKRISHPQNALPPRSHRSSNMLNKVAEQIYPNCWLSVRLYFSLSLYTFECTYRSYTPCREWSGKTCQLDWWPQTLAKWNIMFCNILHNTHLYIFMHDGTLQWGTGRVGEMGPYIWSEDGGRKLLRIPLLERYAENERLFRYTLQFKWLTFILLPIDRFSSGRRRIVCAACVCV